MTLTDVLGIRESREELIKSLFWAGKEFLASQDIVNEITITATPRKLTIDLADPQPIAVTLRR